MQLGKNKGALDKEVSVLKEGISKNSTIEFELEQAKRRVRMLNSRTTFLDHILGMGKSSKGCEDLGYMKGSSKTKVIVQTNAQAKPSSSKNVAQNNPALTNPETSLSNSNKRRPRGHSMLLLQEDGAHSVSLQTL